MGFSDWIAKRAGYVKPAEPTRKKRSFNAAQVGRLTEGWGTTPTPIDFEIKSALKVLRARAREQSQNNDYIRRFMGLIRSNVVGPKGAILRPRIVDVQGASIGRPDRLANDAISKGWADWGKYGSPEVTGGYTWATIQREFIANLARDGEVLIVQHYGREHNKFGYALQFLDPELLDVELNLDSVNGGNKVVMGVEMNAFNKPVAYYILRAAKSAQVTGLFSYGERQYTRYPADRIIHRFLPEEGVSQTRGVPWMASSLYRLGMLNGYEEAELVAARVASSKMGFFEQEGGSDSEYDGEEDSDGNIISDAEPGTFEVLPEGMKFNAWEPNHPSTAFGDFVRANLRGIAAGLGVSYFSLANDLENVNYSSGRLGALEDREIWKALQEYMIESFCSVVYENWLRSALMNQVLVIANGKPLSSAKIDKFKRVSFQGRRWSWVDPQKDLTAQGIALDRNLTSVSEVIREMGKDPDEVFEQIKLDKERFAEMGITPAEVLAAAMPEEPPKPE